MLNSISLMGRLVSEPELRTTASGIAYVKFTVACDRDYGHGEEKKCDFIDCSAWRKTAEFISNNFGKGQMISVVGRLEIDKYTTAGGENRRRAEVVVNTAYFCGSRRDSGDAGNVSSGASSQNSVFEEVLSDESLPFDIDDELPL